MKLLILAVFLALALSANAQRFKGAATQVMQNNKGKPDMGDVVNQVIVLNDKQKKQFSEGLINDMKTTEEKKCVDDLSPVIVDTSVKYLKKIGNREVFYEKEGKQFDLINFISHSKLFKTATSDKCLKSFLKGLKNVGMKGWSWIKPAQSKG